MENRIACFNANHSITEVFLNGKKMILDTTTTNYSYPNFRIDDHGVPVRSAYRNVVYRTPVPDPSNNASNYKRTMELSSAGAMKVDFTGNYTGPRSAGLRGYYKTVPEKDLRKVFERLASQDAPDAKLIDYSTENIYDLNKDVKLTYAYTSKEFTKKAGSLYILKNNSTLPYSFSEISLEKRNYDIEYMSSERRKNEDTYTLAENWNVEFLPESVDIKNDYIHYTAQWTQTGPGKITFTNLFDRFKRIVPVKDYALFKKDVQKILDFESQNVLLSKNKVKNYADLLIMRDGVETDGELLSSTPEQIVFERKKDQKTLTLDSADVLSVEIAHVNGPVKQTIDEIMDNELSNALAVDTSIDKYKGDHKVILLDSHKIRLNTDGTYTWTSRIITKILKEKGKAAGFDNWTYDPQSEKFTIDFGRTINGTSVTNLSSRTIQSKSTISAYPEYKRLRNKKFALPEVKIGSILDYQVTRVIKTDPIHHIFSLPLERGSIGDSHTLDAGSNDSWKCSPNSFYAALPLISKKITIDIPSTVKINEKILNDNDGLIHRSLVKAGDRTIYMYANSRTLDARPAEISKPPAADYQPMILFSEQKSWKQIYKEIGKFFIPSKEDMKVARNFIASLRKDGKGTIEDIFEFMALEITHTGIGIRDYSPIPGSVKQILENKRGSNIDCAWLMTCLLNAFGAEATIGFAPASWFSRKHLKYHPTLAFMSGPLVYCTYKNKTMVLSPLTSTMKMTESAAAWDGRELLLVSPKGIQFLELNSLKDNVVIRTLKGSLKADGKLSIASYKILPRGVNQSTYRNIRSILKEKWALIAQQSMTAGIHPNAQVKDFSYNNVDDLNKDVKIEYKVDIPAYGKTAGDYILFKLPGVSYMMASDATTQTRETSDINLGLRGTSRRNYEITMPKGYTLYYAPAEIKVNEGVLVYKAKVWEKDGVLRFTEEDKTLAATFPRELYENYRAFSKAKADFSEEYIILKKK